MFEFVFDIVGEIIFEILVKGLGYLVLKYVLTLGRAEIDPDGIGSLITGLASWLLIGYAAFLVLFK